MGDEDVRLTPEDYFRQIVFSQLGLDVGDIDRTEMNNLKDLEALVGVPLGSARAGATDPRAFAPEVKYETVVLPSRQLFAEYDQAPNGSLEKSIADAIALNPNQPSAAKRDITQMVIGQQEGKTGVWAERDFADPDKELDRQIAEAMGTIDDMYKERREWNTAVAALDPQGRAAAEAGLPSYEKATETPSAAAKQYTDAGFSTPDERYEQSNFFQFGEDGGAGAARDAASRFRAMRRRASGVDDVKFDDWVDPRKLVDQPLPDLPRSMASRYPTPETSAGGSTRYGSGARDAFLAGGQSTGRPVAAPSQAGPSTAGLNDSDRVIREAIEASLQAPEAPSQNVQRVLDPSMLDGRATGDGLPEFGGPRGAVPSNRDAGASSAGQDAEAARYAAAVQALGTGMSMGGDGVARRGVMPQVFDRELTSEEQAERTNIGRAQAAAAQANRVRRQEYLDWASATGEGNDFSAQGVQWDNEDNLLARNLIARSNAQFDQRNSARILGERQSVGATPLNDQIAAALGVAPKMPQRAATGLSGRSAASSALRKRLAGKK